MKGFSTAPLAPFTHLTLTQDLDFLDIRRFARGTYKGILLVRLHETRYRFYQSGAIA